VIGQILEGHTSSVTAIAASYVSATSVISTIVASASSDSTVMLWQRDDIAGIMNFMASLIYNIIIIRTIHTVARHLIWPWFCYGPRLLPAARVWRYRIMVVVVHVS